ncbi:MAG TPA: amidohydrolase family protein, partial [Gemmatimonadales bacterium]|nr:amidohydrolase family protein [Gemmatimonadales bacterium]
MTRLALAALLAAAPALTAQTVAITGGTVHTAAGAPIERGTVLLRDGRIVAVGGDVTVPADARRIDATGKVVTPGLFLGSSTLGVKLFETGGIGDTRESTKQGDVNASFLVADGLDAAHVTIPVARMEGITTAVTVPEGGLVSGQAALLDLDGSSADEMLVRRGVAMTVTLSQGSKSAGGGTRAGSVARFRQLLLDAREYSKRRQDYRTARIQPLSAPATELEAMLPVLRGEQPVLVTANRRSDIETVLRLKREFGLRVILVGAREGWQVAAELAKERVPVGVDPLANIPGFDAPAARLDNAALLREAGVPVFILASDQSKYRTLRHEAGNAVRHGVSWDDALAGITRVPAEAFGMGDRYGTLAPGKVANVVV